LNGLLAGAEIAIVSVRRSRLRELVEDGNRRAVAVERLRDDPERFLATVQIGITVIGAAAGAFGGVTLGEDFAPAIAWIPGLEPVAPQLAVLLVVVLVSYLSLVLGELVPKSLALRSSERYALFAAPLLLRLARLMRPIVWFLTASSNTVLRLFGDRTTFTEARVSGEEIRQLVEDAARTGSLSASAGEIASRALEFADLRAADVMVHRRFVVALPIDAGEEQVRGALLRQGHRRLPIYEGSIDHVVGYLSWRDVIERIWDRQPLELRALMRPGYFVPETMPAPALLEEMQARRVHLAIALEEHGGMAGIVTLEDLVEELVGEITSEHQPEQPAAFTREADGAVVVQALLPVRDVNRELGIELPELEGATTIGGLCTELAGSRIPQKGEQFALDDGTRIEVVEASHRRVRLVRIRLPRAA
jgi:putative hemolysin